MFCLIALLSPAMLVVVFALLDFGCLDVNLLEICLIKTSFALCWFVFFFYFDGCLVTVSSGSYPSSTQDTCFSTRESWRHRCSLRGIDSRVLDCGSSRVSWEREQRSEGQEDHSEASAACDQRRWGARHSHQRNNRWRWCHPPHPQVSYQQSHQWVKWAWASVPTKSF